MMNIFVTGGTGFVGSHLVEKLLDAGDKVSCLVRNPEKLRHLEGKDVELIVQSELESTIFQDMDAVIHVAGVTKANTQEEYFSGNVDMTRDLIGKLLDADFQKKVIIISSQAVVGPSEGENAVSVTDPPHPQTWYGESKLAMENILREEGDKLSWTILSPPVVFGPRDTDMLESFKLAKKGLNPLINGKDKLISIVYVKDLVDGIIHALKTEKNVRHKKYFIGYSEPVSVTAVNRLAAEYYGVKLRNMTVPAPLLHVVGNVFEVFNKFSSKPNIISKQKVKEFLPQYWVCDTKLFIDELDFHIKYDIVDAVAETLKWYQENEWM